MSQQQQTLTAALVSVIRSTHGWGTGEFAAVVNGSRFERLSYSAASALYETARRLGATASLVDDYRCELIRRTWGLHFARGCSA